MSDVHYLVLAVVQGVTEFIPVSSSGHLVVLQRALKLDQPMLGFDILVHLATALAVVLFTHREWAGMFQDVGQALADSRRHISVGQIWKRYVHLRLIVYILIAFLPAVALGVLVYPAIELLFVSASAAGCGFLVTGAVLLATQRFQKSNQERSVRAGDALSIGLAQAMAMFPGISRSGVTIAAGMFRGLEKSTAARFSFLLSVPTIAAAGIFQLRDGWQMPAVGSSVLAAAFVLALVSGYVSLVVLARLITRARFHYFGYYCIGMGILTLFFNGY